MCSVAGRWICCTCAATERCMQVFFADSGKLIWWLTLLSAVGPYDFCDHGVMDTVMRLNTESAVIWLKFLFREKSSSVLSNFGGPCHKHFRMSSRLRLLSAPTNAPKALKCATSQQTTAWAIGWGLWLWCRSTNQAYLYCTCPPSGAGVTGSSFGLVWLWSGQNYRRARCRLCGGDFVLAVVGVWIWKVVILNSHGVLLFHLRSACRNNTVFNTGRVP